MQEKIKELLAEIDDFKADTKEHVENFRIRLLSKKGKISVLFDEFRAMGPDVKKEFGQKLNELKNKAQEKLDHLKEKLDRSETTSGPSGDTSLPGEPFPLGSRHPVSIVRNRILEIFSSLGFTVSDGPEIEDDWHNFSALNFPEDHPARDMQDTFFIDEKEKIALRTHTSSVQVRVMESTQPPIRTVSPGRTYRNEAISARAHCFFHQVEGLYIDSGVSFADLKQTLLYFSREMFGADT